MKKTIKVSDEVYKWLDEERLTEKGKVSFDDALRFIMKKRKP